MFQKKYIIQIIGLLSIAALVICDRFYLAGISQWREDQGTNIYLAWHFFDWNTPVGLISSIGVPNPNGMLVLGALFALLPGLMLVATALGVIQAFAILIWLFSAKVDDKSYWLVIAFPILSCLAIRGDGVEFWNNVIFITLNAIFLYLFNSLVMLRRPIFLTAIFWLSLFVPSIYLAGAANATIYILMTACFAIYLSKKEGGIKRYTQLDWIILVFGTLVILYLVWIPYFSSVQLHSIRGTSQHDIWYKLGESIGVIYTLPVWLFQFTKIQLPVFYPIHSSALSGTTVMLANLSANILKIQIIWLLVLAGLLIARREMGNIFLLKNVKYASPFLLMLLTYMITPLIGGPSLHKGEYPEMTRQFLPMFLFSIFISLYFLAKNLGLLVRRFTMILAVSYGLSSLACGITFVLDARSFSSAIIESYDVPLRDKVAAVEFVAKASKSDALNNIVEVDYNLVGPWTWIADFGKHMLPFYPPVFTVGRALDYEFERVYGLRNYQEGILKRSTNSAKYIIGYAHECKVSELTEYEIFYFGRVCVQQKRDIIH